MIALKPTFLRNCSGVTRRQWLEVGAASFLGLSLPEYFRARAAGLADPARDVSCILLFLWGGPPHQDTFDLKREAPDSVRGPYQPIACRTPGIEVCELLPRLAQESELYTIVRSATHRETEHPRAAHYMMTGNQVIRGHEWPNLGATVNKFAPAGENQFGSVVLGPRLIDMPITPTGQDGGFLGNSYAPFRIADPTQPPEAIARLAPPPSVSPSRTARRERLAQTIERFQRHVETSATAPFDAAYERAFALATSAQSKLALDLAKEPDAVRDRYGRYTFGQGVLMARRLVEAGVRFVQVNWREHPINDYGFDNHGDNFNKLKQHQLPQLDQTVSALLTDLRDRGLLDSTLVLMTGEFGRTPTINRAAGRDHWPFCFSYLIAGAGLPGGRVIGTSDQFAAYPKDDPVTPAVTAASVFSLLGLDLEALRAAGVIEETHTIAGLQR